jgi:hypothetical protein
MKRAPIGQYYVAKQSHGLSRRIADFLAYAAATHPGEFVPYARIAQVVLALPAQPKDDAPDTERVRQIIYRLRPVLIRHHKRDLVTGGQSGARATIGPLDATVFSFARDMRKLASQASSAARKAHMAIEIGNPSATRLDTFPNVRTWKSECDRVVEVARHQLKWLLPELDTAAKTDTAERHVEEKAAA